MRLLVMLGLLLCCCDIHTAYTATYYVDASAPSDNGTGSHKRPKKYISSGIALMSSGDTLILEDGIYTGTSNMIGTVAPRRFPPAGSAEHYTVIKAQNVGGAILDGDYSDVPFSNANQSEPVASHLLIDGIHFRRGNMGVFEIKGKYHKVTNCGFEDGQSPSDKRQLPIADIVGSASSYVLFEDCWAWGKGRYGIYFGGSSPGVSNSIFRRVVVRQDDAAAGPVSGIMFYNGHDNVCQNCIVIDSADTSPGEHYGAFAATANYPTGSPATLNHQVVGSIGLNNKRYYGFLPQYNIGTFSIINSVLWGNGMSGISASPSTVGVTALDHVTIGANAVDGISGNPGYKNSFIDAQNTLSVKNGRWGFYYGRRADYVHAYGNGRGAQSGTQLKHELTSNPFLSTLKYLPRIEKGSKSGGAKSAGRDMGANLLYRIGGSGKLHGEPGWDQTTTTPLWPFPNEALWSGKMRGYTASGPGGNRGFAALKSPTPLTDYVWGYLGNTVPPFNLRAIPAKGGAITLSWAPNTANADVVGYKVYLGTSSGDYRQAGYVGGKNVGNVQKETISGVTPGIPYFIAVTALDRVKGESGFSYEIIATSRGN
jgi:hypothetical protein